MTSRDHGYRVEVFEDEDESMFKMVMATPIINALRNLKEFAGFSFNEVPYWDLRIMKVDISEHSQRTYFLQYNTLSGRYRLIVQAPPDQIPTREELTMKSNTNRSPTFKKPFINISHTNFNKRRVSQIMRVLDLLKNNNFWNDLNDLYEKYKELNKRCENMMMMQKMKKSKKGNQNNLEEEFKELNEKCKQMIDIIDTFKEKYSNLEGGKKKTVKKPVKKPVKKTVKKSVKKIE
jgi:hypothetical protein